VKSHGDVAAGAVIGGILGAIVGGSLAGRHDGGGAVVAGAALGAAGGAAVAASTGSNDQSGLPSGLCRAAQCAHLCLFLPRLLLCRARLVSAVDLHGRSLDLSSLPVPTGTGIVIAAPRGTATAGVVVPDGVETGVVGMMVAAGTVAAAAWHGGGGHDHY
jgi:hypothetical protein